MSNEKYEDKLKSFFRNIREDIFFFAKKAFGKTPQPLLPKYKDVPYQEWEAKHFGSIVDKDERGIPVWDFPTFDKKKHLTWQQAKILHYVNASQKGGKRMIAVVSGRGIGKTFTECIIILWSLLQARDTQGACTSYSTQLIYDILWKELSKAVQNLKGDFQQIFEWQSTRIVVKDRPHTWFISAKTGKKENPEALAGVHGDFVLIMADEASGVPTEIFETALDGLSDPNYLVFLASNGRRLTGFFYDQFQRKNGPFELLSFNSLESPLYDPQKARDIYDDEEQNGGRESDRFLIEVLGGFPNKEGLDDKGYKPLLNEDQLNLVDSVDFIGAKRMMIDYAGEGRDTTIWGVRDEYSARIVDEEGVSDDKSVDRKTDLALTKYDVDDVIGDSFGIGADSLIRLSRKRRNVKGKNVGNPSLDPKERFANLKAEAYWRMREWIIKGGQLEKHKRWKDLLSVRYRRNLAGKIEIMPKEVMRKAGYPSPDAADMLMLSFTEPLRDLNSINRARKRRAQKKKASAKDNPYSMSTRGY